MIEFNLIVYNKKEVEIPWRLLGIECGPENSFSDVSRLGR